MKRDVGTENTLSYVGFISPIFGFSSGKQELETPSELRGGGMWGWRVAGGWGGGGGGGGGGGTRVTEE